MNEREAAKILNLDGDITPEKVKKAYRELSKKYHPDRNPAGKHMMVLINEAYKTLKNTTATMKKEYDGDYSEELSEALKCVQGLENVTIEVVGSWVWISGDTYPHRKIIKDCGFLWASKKKMWYYRPEGSKTRSKGDKSYDEIKDKYGFTTFRNGKKKIDRRRK